MDCAQSCAIKRSPHDMPLQAQREGGCVTPAHSQAGTRIRWVANITPRSPYSWGITRYPLCGRLSGPRWRYWRPGKCRLHWDSIHGPSSSWRFAVPYLGRLSWVLFVCLFSWLYNPLWLYFHSPVAGFSLLVFEVSWSHTMTRNSR
jgi:hypothetical protein